jgi:hypothetical protein
MHAHHGNPYAQPFPYQGMNAGFCRIEFLPMMEGTNKLTVFAAGTLVRIDHQNLSHSFPFKTGSPPLNFFMILPEGFIQKSKGHLLIKVQKHLNLAKAPLLTAGIRIAPYTLSPYKSRRDRQGRSPDILILKISDPYRKNRDPYWQ